MKTLYSILAALVLTGTSAFISQACDNSSFTLNSHVDLGGGLHQYTVTFCAGSGQGGAEGQTGLWAVRLDGGATFSSYPATLTSPNTAAVYGADNVSYGPEYLVYDAISWPSNSPYFFPNAWTCLEGNCGPAQATCVTFTYVTVGVPTSMTLMGAEAAGVGVPPYGCNGEPDMVINLGSLTVDAGADVAFCIGGCASLSAAVSGGTAPYTYSWAPQYNGGASLTSANITVCPTQNELYHLTVTDANGLTNSDFISVVVHQKPTVNAGTDKVKYIGYGATCVTLSGSANGTMPAYTYSWSNGAATASTSVCPNITTNYTLTATDAYGCSNSDVAQVRVYDIRCGSNKIKMCKNGTTYCVPNNQVQSKLNQGFTIGGCGMNKTDESIIELSEETMSSIFPNPASAEVTLSYTFVDDVTVSVSVFDVSGRLLHTISSNISAFAGEQNTQTIPVSGLPSGFYFVGINASNGESIMHKLMVAR